MALDYFAPGVYVEEVDKGSRPIEGISLSVAGFIGFTEDVRGDAELFKPMMVTSWDQYREYFGAPGSDGFTDYDAYLPFVAGSSMGEDAAGYQASVLNYLVQHLHLPKLRL